MGACLCRSNHHDDDPHDQLTSLDCQPNYNGRLRPASLIGALFSLTRGSHPRVGHLSQDKSSDPVIASRIHQLQTKLSVHADRLVLDTLESTRPTHIIETSNSMQKLHLIAETEIGWIVVISSLINKVDVEHPFGSALIMLILENAPLPSKASICQLCHELGAELTSDAGRTRSMAIQRNICIVLGCLAEKLAGSLSSSLFTSTVLEYLLLRLSPSCGQPTLMLYALIALEKFSQTIDNKLMIVARLKSMGPLNPLLKLERLATSSDFVEQQVAFCARWALDNHFLYEGRKYSHETISRDNLNVLLNYRDASENLKISPDGLTARNDTSRFESVRCTYAIATGCYYYEAQLVTAGVMQIGLATKNCKYLNHDGIGIGDDDQSLAYDGCRQLIWQNGQDQRTQLPAWKEGDVVGCLIDLDRFQVRFSLNGQMGEPNSDLFVNKSLSTQYYAAASFMPFQQCVFNFGRVPFKYAPIDYDFKSFNQCAFLTEDETIVLPRHLVIKNVHSTSLMLDTCTICCDNIARVTLDPCDHCGFCEICANLLDLCPLCRTEIKFRKVL